MTTDEIILSVYNEAKERKIHPSGTFDKAKRWYPDDAFKPFVDEVRSPTRGYPFSLMAHCRTRKFIKKLMMFCRPVTIEEAIDIYCSGGNTVKQKSNAERFILSIPE